MHIHRAPGETDTLDSDNPEATCTSPGPFKGRLCNSNDLCFLNFFRRRRPTETRVIALTVCAALSMNVTIND